MNAYPKVPQRINRCIFAKLYLNITVPQLLIEYHPPRDKNQINDKILSKSVNPAFLINKISHWKDCINDDQF